MDEIVGVQPDVAGGVVGVGLGCEYAPPPQPLANMQMSRRT